MGGDTYRAGLNGRTDTGVSNAYSRPNTGPRSGNDHRDNGRGKGGILMVVLLCGTILIAAHMIADGMKSANQNQVAATTIETTPQEAVPAETSEEDEDEPEETADEEQEQTEKEPVIKDKVRLTSLDPVNVVSRFTGHDDFPTVSDITDVWKNNYTSAYIMEWSYEFTYDTNGEYDAFAATLCTTSTSNSTGKLQIYDADGTSRYYCGNPGWRPIPNRNPSRSTCEAVNM